MSTSTTQGAKSILGPVSDRAGAGAVPGLVPG